MKNIHILPTDKASRLVLDVNKNLSLAFNKSIEESAKHRKHIYITSDEEIKEGDWLYVKTPNIYGGNVIAKSLGNSNGCWADHILTQTTDEKGYHPSHCVKIILTTDQDLIKNGVQAIDDDFLEWFVKNPSCEFVQTLWTIPAYKIEKEYRIEIPKEEPKQHLEYINNNIEEFEGKLKEFKQVTSIDWLEKQLDNNDFSNHQMEINISMSLPKYIEIFKQSKEMYNQERMYSEEDLKQSYSQGWMTRERFDDLSPEIVYPDGLDYEEKQEYAFNLWFNQFKKK
jgi:hypothetical protein